MSRLFKMFNSLLSFDIIQARVEKNHEVLEIGCGWGSLAIELVKRTGCKYTGITLSEEQLKFAQKKVRDAGLQVQNIIKKLPYNSIFYIKNVKNHVIQVC